MQEELLTPDLSYRNKIYKVPEKNVFKEDDTNKILMNHRVVYNNSIWKENNKVINWGNGINISITYSNDYNFKLIDDTDIIDNLLPINKYLYFYRYNNYDNEKSYAQRDWTFNKGMLNPYNKTAVFSLTPHYQNRTDDRYFYTFGLGDLFNNVLKIS